MPVAFQGGAGVDIERSAVLVGKLLQGKLFGLKLTVCVVVKVIQGAVPSLIIAARPLRPV